MRPDVALAFDRMAAAARREAGLYLLVTSGYRSDAEQARLFAANPDPRWVAPPGHSLHRYATELDLGPATAYAWLAANSERFGFIRRYSWEPWHYGFARNTGSASVGYGGGSGDGQGAVPSFVPARFHAAIVRASQRWNVGAALLSAQIYAESNFNPFAQSPAGAQGIAQFMPGTAQALGLHDPFDPERRSMPRPISCAICCAASARFRSRLPRTTPAPARSSSTAAFRRTRRRAPTWRRSSACWAARAT